MDIASLAKKYEPLGLATLCLVTLVVRIGLLIFSIDIPGDGPSRAAMAYAWAKSPYLVTHGGWLPGFLYLAGIFNIFVADPLFASRVLNLILGSVTIPLYYLLIRRLYNRVTAFFASLLLAVFPLHVGLSVSSLADVSFVFATIASMVLLVGTTEKQENTLRTGLSLLLFCWAQFTRYEAWLLTPALALFLLIKTQRVGITALRLFILSIVPGSWMFANYWYGGHALPALNSVRHGAVLMSADKLDFVGALQLLGAMSVSHLGGVLVIAIIGGLIWQFISLTNSPNRPDRLMYIVAVCFYWMGMVYLAMNIGTTLWNRFLMFGFTISIPLAFLPFTERLIYRRRSTATIICLGLLALSMATFPRQRPLWVTPYSPTEIKNIAAWLKESPYRDDAVLVTQMDWKSTYLPLYFPEVRMGMISSWVEDDEVHDFLRNQHPSLLITWEGESELQARIEYLTKKSIAEHSLIHEEGPIKVYRLRSQP